jgi:hypothetical protein
MPALGHMTGQLTRGDIGGVEPCVCSSGLDHRNNSSEVG